MKKVLGILCCIICSGPILVIVGIVLLVTPNDRADRVAEYNRAVTSFDSDGISGWATGGTIGGQSVTVITDSVPMESGQEDVTTTGQSTYAYNTQSPFNAVSSSQTFTLGNVDTFSRTLTKTQSYTTSVYCSRSTTCSSDTQQDTCEDNHPGGSYSGGSCSSKSSCGSCSYDAELYEYCAVVTRDDPDLDAWSESAALRSCFYPFALNSQRYSSSSSSIRIRVMDSTDPFIALEKTTKGTGEFGVTAEQQRTTGIVLLVIGLVIIAVLGIILFVVIRMIMSAAGGSGNNAAPVATQQQQPVQAYPVQQQQYPVQQQQQYPAAQQGGGYGSPPPAGGYGSPPPAGGYGAPPPNAGYAQPAQGYPVAQVGYNQQPQAYPVGAPQQYPAYGQGANPAYGGGQMY